LVLSSTFWIETNSRKLKVIKLFLEFLKTFDYCQIHNMLALMLNPHFKSSWVVGNFVGCENAIYFIIKYDIKRSSPFQW
jgi:hypothetical protein